MRFRVERGAADSPGRACTITVSRPSVLLEDEPEVPGEVIREDAGAVGPRDLGRECENGVVRRRNLVGRPP